MAWKLDMPAGSTIGSLFAVAVFRSFGVQPRLLSKQCIIYSQVSLGAFLGLTFTPFLAKTFATMITVSIVYIFLTIINGLILGYVTHKMFKRDLTTSLLASASAGITQMSFLF